MANFAFIAHPLEIENFYRWQPWTRIFPKKLLKYFLPFLPSLKISTIKVNLPGQILEGHLIMCPLLPEQFINFEEKRVLKKIIKAVKVGERLGAKVIGLGAYTSVVADKGITISKQAKANITTGNSLTVAMIIDGCTEALKMKGLALAETRVAVIGATGSIGKACTKILAKKTKEIVLCAPSVQRLMNLKETLENQKENSAVVTLETEPKKAIKDAHITIIASSAPAKILDINDFNSNAIVCDVSVPSNVNVSKDKSSDIFYFKGGLVMISDKIKIGFNIGLPKNILYACIVETIILALEDNLEDFSLGNELSISNIDKIGRLSSKYYFQPWLC